MGKTKQELLRKFLAETYPSVDMSHAIRTLLKDLIYLSVSEKSLLTGLFYDAEDDFAKEIKQTLGDK